MKFSMTHKEICQKNIQRMAPIFWGNILQTEYSGFWTRPQKTSNCLNAYVHKRKAGGTIRPPFQSSPQFVFNAACSALEIALPTTKQAAASTTPFMPTNATANPSTFFAPKLSAIS